MFFMAGSQADTIQNKSEKQFVALHIENLALKVDRRIVSLKMLANTVANDTHIHQWVSQGFGQNQEEILLKKLGYLVTEYGLTSASFADTHTHKYWNHEGFLRVLDPEIDTWYFAYLSSEQENLISVYHDKNKQRVDVYVNYRQLNGNGLSGIATSFDGVIDLLENSPLTKQGEVFIVDAKGLIQVHNNTNIAGKLNLSQRYGKKAARALLNQSTFTHFATEQTKDQYLVSSYIPSMGWYLVAQLNGEIY